MAVSLLRGISSLLRGVLLLLSVLGLLAVLVLSVTTALVIATTAVASLLVVLVVAGHYYYCMFLAGGGVLQRIRERGGNGYESERSSEFLSIVDMIIWEDWSNNFYRQEEETGHLLYKI